MESCKEIKKDYIFISFSKALTNGVAEELQKIIKSVYQGKNVEVFVSSESIKAGQFKGQILEAMKNAKFAISILSPENKSSPWLMYEAGALSLAVEQNGGHLMPYLFCRNEEDVEPTIKDLQYVQFQRRHSRNLSEIIKLIENLNDSLSIENKVKKLEIRTSINDLWGEVSESLNAIAYNLLNPGASSAENYSLNTKKNGSISISPIESSFYTDGQCVIRLMDDFVPKTPKEIEEKLEMILRTSIPRKWTVQNSKDKDYNATRVVVNKTRFSTFVAFTDGERVVLFDRYKDSKNTNVTNDRLDVFGSVQFENRSIKAKIKNNVFFDAEIIKIEEISGAAIENNQLKIGDDVETAVMFGACVYLSPSDLDKAKIGAVNGEIFVCDLDNALSMNSDTLTSKALLSIRHICRKSLVKV